MEALAEQVGYVLCPDCGRLMAYLNRPVPPAFVTCAVCVPCKNAFELVAPRILALRVEYPSEQSTVD